MPMYQQVAKHLKEQILSGKLPPMTRLPTERELSAELRVNRETLSKALSKLSYEGLIVRQRSKGTFVTDTAVRTGTQRKSIGLILPWGDASSLETDTYIAQVFAAFRMNLPSYCDLNMQVYNDKQGYDGLQRNYNYDGMLIIAPRRESKDKLLDFKKSGVPFVVVDAGFEGDDFNCVRGDNMDCTVSAIDYLVSLGHKRIAYISGKLNYINAIERLKGFQAGIRRHGLEYRKEHISTPLPTEEFHDIGRRAAAEFLTARKAPTAIITYNLDILLDAIKVLKSRNIRIPEDMSIIAFGDPQIAAYNDPPITVIKRPLKEMCAKALEILMKQVSGSSTKPVQVTVKRELVVAKSCAAPK